MIVHCSRREENADNCFCTIFDVRISWRTVFNVDFGCSPFCFCGIFRNCSDNFVIGLDALRGVCCVFPVCLVCLPAHVSSCLAWHWFRCLFGIVCMWCVSVEEFGCENSVCPRGSSTDTHTDPQTDRQTDRHRHRHKCFCLFVFLSVRYCCLFKFLVSSFVFVILSVRALCFWMMDVRSYFSSFSRHFLFRHLFFMIFICRNLICVVFVVILFFHMFCFILSFMFFRHLFIDFCFVFL